MAGGRKIEVITGSSDASPDSAIAAARKLVEQDGVQILIGPLSGSEGLALRDYAKTQPQVTFVNGTSAAADTTLREPADNFFRFTTDGTQWQAGLGEYVYNDKGWHTAVVVAEDYSFPYSQVMGFMLPFCEAGGKVVDKFWVPIGTKDYSSIVASIPDDVDAIYVARGGADGVNFLTQYQQAGGDSAADRRLDHRRPDGAGLRGQAEGEPDRHALRRSDRRQLGRPALEGLRIGLPGGLPERLPLALALRARLLRWRAGHRRRA